jgi:hypothetical protein
MAATRTDTSERVIGISHGGVHSTSYSVQLQPGRDGIHGLEDQDHQPQDDARP